MTNFMRFLLMLCISTVLFSGCTNEQPDNNIAISTNAIPAKLEQIISQPQSYIDKEIVIEGNFFNACSTSCCDNEFILKDGINQIKVIANKELDISKLKATQPIKLSGIVKPTAQTPFIQANAIEAK